MAENQINMFTFAGASFKGLFMTKKIANYYNRTWMWFLFLIIMTASMSSCHQKVAHIEMEVLDSLCDVNPQKALDLLSTYENAISKSPRDVRMRYALLLTKARDKSFISHTSDSLMMEVVSYYENHGDVNERLEAMYYMGSVYRDMHDSPRALQWYLKATDWGERHIEEVDSTILRNVYAQLADIYSIQRDARLCLAANKREFLLDNHALQDPTTMMDLALSYMGVRQPDSALSLFDSSLEHIQALGEERKNIDIIAAQLSWLASLPQKQDEARIRLAIIRQHLDLDTIYNVASSLGNYYARYGPSDSAIFFNKRAMDCSTKLKVKRSTARRLAMLYRQMGLKDSSLRYADLYMQLNDSLTEQQQSEETQVVQNEFEYQRNKEAEEEAYRQAAEAKEKLLKYGIAALLMLTLLLIILWQREKKAKREIVKRDVELEMQSSQMTEKDRELALRSQRLEELDRTLTEKEERLADLDLLLGAKEDEMSAIRDELYRTQGINEELASQFELEQKKKEVTELSEVQELLRKKANGHQVGKTKRELIKDLFATIDYTDPLFAQQLRHSIPDISRDDLTMAYMRHAGLTALEISKLVGMDRSSVHRHLKVLESLLAHGEDASTQIGGL